MFEYDYLDTCCLGCLVCMCSIFLYLHMFSTVEHVSHWEGTLEIHLLILSLLLLLLLMRTMNRAMRMMNDDEDRKDEISLICF